MGGLDAIVFTGGIGENSSMARAFVLRDLDFLGIQLDDDHNNVQGKEEREISSKVSRVKIFVIPTNEELVIALDTMRIVSQKD